MSQPATATSATPDRTRRRIHQPGTTWVPQRKPNVQIAPNANAAWPRSHQVSIGCTAPSQPWRFSRKGKGEHRGAGEPEPGADDVDDEPRQRRHAGAAVGSGRPGYGH